jgi:hypothetical protein
MAAGSSPYDFDARTYEDAWEGIRRRLPTMMQNEHGINERAAKKTVPTMRKYLKAMDFPWRNRNHGLVQVDCEMRLVEEETQLLVEKWRLRIDVDPEDTTKQKPSHIGFEVCSLSAPSLMELGRGDPWRGHAFVKKAPPHFRSNRHVTCGCGLPERTRTEIMNPEPADTGREWRISVKSTVHSALMGDAAPDG